MISNGYIKKKPMQELARHLTAVKIDFKAFTEKFYAEICAGHLKPVLDNLKTLRELNIWFELVYLMIYDRLVGLIATSYIILLYILSSRIC